MSRKEAVSWSYFKVKILTIHVFMMQGTVEILDESQHLEEDFQNLVNDMENYLRPVIAAVDAALRSWII